MKLDKHLLGAAGIVGATVCLITLTWIGTLGAIHAQGQENAARVEAALANQALSFNEQINQQFVTLDQTLRILVTAYERNPPGFDLDAWREQAVALNGLSRDMILADEIGVVRQSSVAAAVNQTVADEDYFQALSKPADPADRTFIGSATTGAIAPEWHMNVSRAVHHPDGSFAGVIAVDYRTASITGLFGQTDLGPGALDAVVGLTDGKLRAALGPAAIGANASIDGTPVFAAILHGSHGIWVGASPIDGVTRLHAFRRLSNQAWAVIVAVDQQEAMRPAAIWRRQSDLFAGCITVALAGMALLLLQSRRQERLRAAALVEDRAVLASANTQLEVARAVAAAKAEQLEATLGGMSDGVSMFDAQMCLVAWNEGFPEVAGVPADILRVGLPIEEILRAQVIGGQFGKVDDMEAEITRRMLRLRSAQFGVVQRQRPDGHTIELRRNSLPEGGFVTLYADITDHKRAEAALREARATAEEATAAKSRFVAIVSHEIRTPLNALLNSLQLLADSVLAPAQRSLLAMARQSGDALFGLVNDILEMAQIEAGKLMIRPTRFDLPRLLASSVEMFQAQAAERGITLRVRVGEAAPAALLADAGRLRQVLLNLLSNALKYSTGAEIWLEARPGQTAQDAVRLLVKDGGPVIEAAARARLFQPFSRLQQPAGDGLIGSGLGLSICQELVTLMGGAIGCEPWTTQDGQQGNAFWMSLPASALLVWPAVAAASALPGQAFGNQPRRRLPRTRVLLVEDVAANQVITATLLRRAGHMVDIAPSGQAAVDAMKQSPYDLVFMDIFMPGMNGHEATATIRSLAEPARSRPIIALTADASPEDEIVIRASGMDGMLSKPVSVDQLIGVLHAHVWCGHRLGDAVCGIDPAALAGRKGGRPGQVEGDDIAPVLAADRILEIRANLPPQTVVTLVEACLVDLDHRLPALQHAFATGSIGAITVHAHAMVGMAAGYGMSALETSLRAIMAAARAGDTTALGPDAIARVESDLAAPARALREMLQDALA